METSPSRPNKPSKVLHRTVASPGGPASARVCVCAFVRIGACLHDFACEYSVKSVCQEVSVITHFAYFASIKALRLIFI